MQNGLYNFMITLRGNRDVVMSGWRTSKIIDVVERQSVIQNDPFL